MTPAPAQSDRKAVSMSKTGESDGTGRYIDLERDKPVTTYIGDEFSYT